MVVKVLVVYLWVLCGLFRGEWWLDGVSVSVVMMFTRDGW